MAVTTAQVQQAYVAFFNRPADLAGLNYWTSSPAASVANLLDAFSKTPEYTSLYSNMNSTQLVNAVYQNLFGRPVESVDALNYWVGLLGKGTVTLGSIAATVAGLAITNKTADGTLVSNKVTAATAFTTSLSTASNADSATAYATANSTGLQAVKNWLAAVTSDATTLTNATSTTTLDSLLNTVKSNVASTGSTFTLTTGVDNLVGTSGNDTIIGGVGSAGGASTLGSADVINGGAGTDTLKVTTEGTAGAAVTPSLTSVENVTVQALATGGATVVNMVNATGTTTLLNERSTGALTFSNVQELATVAAKGDVSGGNYIAQFKSSLVSGAADSLNISLDGATIGTLGLGSAVTAEEFETLNFAVTGTNKITTLQDGVSTGLAGTKTVNVSGDGKLTVTNAFATGNLATVNASTNTGGVSFDLTGNTKNVTFTGGSGNDTVLMGAGLATTDVLNGGTGTNTIGVSSGALLVDGLQVTNFQTLDIRGSGATSAGDTYNMAKLAGITTVEVGAAINAAGSATNTTVTVNNLAKGAGVSLKAAIGDNAADNLAIVVKDAGAGSPNDTIGVTLSGATAVTTTGVLTIADIETVNLTASKATATTAPTHVLSTLTAANATSINVTNGDAKLTVGSLAGSTALVLLDGSAATQDTSVTTGAVAFAATGGTAFKLGAGNDTLVLTGATSASTGTDFVITGGAGGDAVTLTATGATQLEKLVYTAATDSQVGVNKFDSITNFVTTEDKIDLKAFNFSGASVAALLDRTGKTIGTNGEVAAADQSNWFNDGTKKSVVIVETGGAGGDVWVYADVNADGNYDAGDLAIKVVGVGGAGAGAQGVVLGDFIFA